MDRRLLAALFRPGSRLSLEVDSSDADLLARFAATADDAAFAEIVRRHGPLVWGVCSNLLTNSADAEDAFQATFLALVQSPRAVRRAASLPGFLHGVAVRVAAKLKRGAVRRKQREAKVAVPEADSPVPDSAWDDVYAVIQDEVRRLPASLRAAFLVCEVGGVPHAEAARQLGWKTGTLSGTLARAKQRLIVRLGQRGIGPAAAVAGVCGGAATGPAAVPWRLIEAVGLFPKAAAGAVPVVLVKLAAEGLTVGVSYTKLLAVAVVAAGGLAVGVGPVVLPVADAQPYSGPTKPTPLGLPAKKAEEAAPGGKPERPGDDIFLSGVRWEYTWNGPQWAYRLVRKPAAGANIAAFMAERGKDGWEYAGLLAGDFAVSKSEDMAAEGMVVGQVTGPVELMVFKRPVPPPVAAAPGSGPGVEAARPLSITFAYSLRIASAQVVSRQLQSFFSSRHPGAAAASNPKFAFDAGGNILYGEVAPGDRAEVTALVRLMDTSTSADPAVSTLQLPKPPAVPPLPGSPPVVTKEQVPPTSLPTPRPITPPQVEPEPVSIGVDLLASEEAAAVAEGLLGKLSATQGGPVRVRAVPTAGIIMIFGATPEVAKRIDGAISELADRARMLAERNQEVERRRQKAEAERLYEEKKLKEDEQRLAEAKKKAEEEKKKAEQDSRPSKSK